MSEWSESREVVTEEDIRREPFIERHIREKTTWFEHCEKFAKFAIACRVGGSARSLAMSSLRIDAEDFKASTIKAMLGMEQAGTLSCSAGGIVQRMNRESFHEDWKSYVQSCRDFSAGAMNIARYAIEQRKVGVTCSNILTPMCYSERTNPRFFSHEFSHVHLRDCSTEHSFSVACAAIVSLVVVIGARNVPPPVVYLGNLEPKPDKDNAAQFRMQITTLFIANHFSLPLFFH